MLQVIGSNFSACGNEFTCPSYFAYRYAVVLLHSILLCLIHPRLIQKFCKIEGRVYGTLAN